MQKIGLLELANHNEVLRAYIIILLESRMVSSIQIFTTRWNFNQLYDFQENPILNWHIIEDVSELSKFEDITNSLALLLQTTIEDDSAKVVEVSVNCKLAVVIHKANCQFSPYNNLRFSIQPIEFIKDIGRLLKFSFLKRPALKRVERSADFLVFPSNNALEKAVKTKAHKICLPFTVNDEISMQYFREKFYITIPGIITDKSRNYEIVIEALNNINCEDIELTLLGKPKGKYGQKVLEAFSIIPDLKVNSFNEFIPQEIFDQLMRSADFLILPMQEKMSFGVISEHNGYSCVSGNINDMVRYGIPSLIPSYYPVDNNLNNITEKFENANDLSHLISKWVSEKTFNKIKKDKMHNAMQLFSRKVFSKEFEEEFFDK